YVVTVGSAKETVAWLCGSGVLARHPELRVVMAESGSGWLAWTLHAMDDAYREHAMWVDPKLDDLPSEYFSRQGAVTFQHDPARATSAAARATQVTSGSGSITSAASATPTTAWAAETAARLAARLHRPARIAFSRLMCARHQTTSSAGASDRMWSSAATERTS